MCFLSTFQIGLEIFLGSSTVARKKNVIGPVQLKSNVIFNSENKIDWIKSIGKHEEFT